MYDGYESYNPVPGSDDITENEKNCRTIHTAAGGFFVYAQFFWTLSISLRSSEIFKLNKQFRQLYCILRVSIGDCAAFISIYVYMLFAISIMMQIKVIKDGSAQSTWSFFGQIGDAFSLTLGFGDPPSAKLGEDPPEGKDLADWLSTAIGPGEWLIFGSAMFTINILILNTLIAILGDSYDKVVMDR
jgi:hypothetical protein